MTHILDHVIGSSELNRCLLGQEGGGHHRVLGDRVTRFVQYDLFIKHSVFNNFAVFVKSSAPNIFHPQSINFIMIIAGFNFNPKVF